MRSFFNGAGDGSMFELFNTNIKPLFLKSENIILLNDVNVYINRMVA